MESYVEAARKLNAQMKQVMKKAHGDTGGLVPPIITPTARIVSMDLTSEVSAGGEVLYTYKLKYTTEEEVQKREKKKKVKEVKEEEEPVPLLKKMSSMIRIPGKVRCDGPCRKVVDLLSTIQFGCDHSICDACRQNSQSVACFDGSPGCCNENCVAQGKAEGNKTRAGPKPGLSDSTQSVASNKSAANLIIEVHVAIIKCCGRVAYRTQLDLEFPSECRISKLVNTLRNYYKDEMENSRFYYSVEKPKHSEHLEPFSLTDTHLRFYDIAHPADTEHIYFLVVGDGITLF